ncbi:MAG: ABC transporter ATP-binding protein [Thermoanaerobaculia bacterium]|nr:ABC transporter ATP-binding protein [Thermoanaerobaculia bacterium]
MTSILRVENLHLRHPGTDRDVVRDLQLEVAAGEILCLVGPNGSGKSTSLAALARELRPRHGRVLLDGEDVWRIPRQRFARRVARLPQEPQCPEGLTVEQLVMAGRHAHLGLFGAWRTSDANAVHEALVAMDLLELRHRAVDTLSGGERRRAWIAMVLCQEAEVLLLDEPTAGLDIRHEWEVLDLLSRIRRDRGVTLVLVLHQLDQAAKLADRVAIFHRGRLYRAGDPSCLDDETLRDVFGVDASLTEDGGFHQLTIRAPADPNRHL